MYRAPPLQLLALLLVLPAIPAQANHENHENQEKQATHEKLLPVEVAREGEGALWKVGGQRVLFLKGTPRDMGLQHGKLLAAEVKLLLPEVLAWTARRGCDRACLQAILDAHSPHLPAEHAQEMEGLAEGSGVALEVVRLVHAMPERFHCSGVAVRGAATRDGKLYHTRSLDYALDIGVTTRLQNHAVLIVRQPSQGFATVVPAWAGFLGAVTGMSSEGIGIGEMGCSSRDEAYAGIPMMWMVRLALERARTLEQAVAVFEKGPRTCGFNFIVSSGDEKEAVALEVTRSHFAQFKMGAANEDVAPHFALPDAVRRVNHFVDPKLAATQRDPYDPRTSAASSFAAYETISEYLQKERGKLDAARLIALLRIYPPAHGCLHQAVLAGTDREIFVSQAGDDRVLPFPGAQNQDFYRYSLRALFARKPEPVEVLGPEYRAEPAPLAAAIELPAAELPATVRAEWRSVLELGLAAGRVETTPLQRIGRSTVHRLRFVPKTGAALETTWHRRDPSGSGKQLPAVVLLATGEPTGMVERTLAAALDRLGVSCIVIPILQFPLDGEAAPLLSLERSVSSALVALRFLRSRPEVDAARVTVVGAALGAGPATAAAWLDPGSARLCLAFTAPRFATFIENGRALGKALGLDDAERKRLASAATRVEPAATAAWLQRRPVLLLALEDDKDLTRAAQEELAKLLPDPEVVWFPGRLSQIVGRAPEIVARIHKFASAAASR